MIDDLAARAVAAPPRCGATRLVCVDGPSGAGKTQLAAHLAVTLGDPPLLHMDNLYPGWDGLADGVVRLRADVVAPLAAGRPARYRRWDWARSAYAEYHDLGTPPLLIIEGVGAGAVAPPGSTGQPTSAAGPPTGQRESAAESLVAAVRPQQQASAAGRRASPSRPAAAATSLLVWLDAPEAVRHRRAMERDGATYAPHWARWAAQERAHFAADRTRDRADVVLFTG